MTRSCDHYFPHMKTDAPLEVPLLITMDGIRGGWDFYFHGSPFIPLDSVLAYSGTESETHMVLDSDEGVKLFIWLNKPHLVQFEEGAGITVPLNLNPAVSTQCQP